MEHRDDCGGFFKPIMPIDVALRTTIANLAIERDIVALVLNSYGTSDLKPSEISWTFEHTIRNAIVSEEAVLRGHAIQIEEILNDCLQSQQRARDAYESFIEQRRKRISSEIAFTQFKGMGALLEDADIDQHIPLKELHKSRSPRVNPHIPPHHRANVKIPEVDEDKYEKFAKNSKKSEVFKADNERKTYLRKAVAAYEEREYFIRQLMRHPNEICTFEVFAPIFLYGFTHSSAVQRIVCAKFCSARLNTAYQLHPMKHIAFISQIPILYDHYYNTQMPREHFVALATHLHTFGFVPLLSAADMQIAMKE